MEPVLTAFGDRVLFLKHNLNAQAIASLQGHAASIEADVYEADRRHGGLDPRGGRVPRRDEIRRLIAPAPLPFPPDSKGGSMGLVSEFKAFAMRGNVVDMAVGIIIGGAFGKIVSSLVSDVMMPPIGKLMGDVNFSSLFIALDGKEYASLEAAKTAGAPTINYGSFTQTVIDFVIIAFAVFMIIKAMNAREEGSGARRSGRPRRRRKCS